MLEQVVANTGALPERASMDAGYFSGGTVEAVADASLSSRRTNRSTGNPRLRCHAEGFRRACQLRIVCAGSSGRRGGGPSVTSHQSRPSVVPPIWTHRSQTVFQFNS